ncbi:hypothetical protein [Vallitalea guaymasensis]|nr:hypothetical protein [Vallitalea guaymasensis]
MDLEKIVVNDELVNEALSDSYSVDSEIRGEIFYGNCRKDDVDSRY